MLAVGPALTEIIGCTKPSPSSGTPQVWLGALSFPPLIQYHIVMLRLLCVSLGTINATRSNLCSSWFITFPSCRIKYLSVAGHLSKSFPDAQWALCCLFPMHWVLYLTRTDAHTHEERKKENLTLKFTLTIIQICLISAKCHYANMNDKGYKQYQSNR